MERKDFWKKQIDLRYEVIEEIKKQLGIRNITSINIDKWTHHHDYYNEYEDTDKYNHIVDSLEINATDKDGWATIPCLITNVIVQSDNTLGFEGDNVYSDEKEGFTEDDFTTPDLICLYEILITLFEKHDKNEIKLY